MGNLRGIIIEESLENREVLEMIKIIKTKVEQVKEEHKTPWIKQWTLHTVEIPEDSAGEIASEIAISLDSKHEWYADFRNKKTHFIIFRNRVFEVKGKSKEQYEKVKEYGLSLGIPSYQLDFD